MIICIVEDSAVANFLPLVYFRPVAHLRCGIFSLEGIIRNLFPAAQYVLHTRPYLAEYLRECHPSTPVNEFPDSDLWLINSRVLADEDFAKLIKKHKKGECVFMAQGQFAAAFLYRNTVAAVREALSAG